MSKEVALLACCALSVAIGSCDIRPHSDPSPAPAATRAPAIELAQRLPVPTPPSNRAPLLAIGGSRFTESASFSAISGRELIASIASSGARAVLVNAWASWCTPCRDEMPMLHAIAVNLKSRGLEVVLVSVDEPESEPSAIAFLNQLSLRMPTYVAERPLSVFKPALNPRWPGMLPSTFLFDGTGKLRYFWGGPIYEAELLPKLEAYFAGTLQDGEAKFELSKGRVDP